MVAVPGPCALPGGQEREWTLLVTNDNCPDYTWGLTEEQTRQAFADIVRAHLEEMTRTDGEPPESQSRYNMAVTQEALCFVERYPERKQELIRRIKEGRLYVSPFLCNTLWGFNSTEGAIRALYPARRLEREWGLAKTAVAEHIEEPSLPWGMATILSGCGIRWLSSPFYAYDSAFAGLTTPPVFEHEGPDGSRVRVIMDPWACNRWSYQQGRALLKDPTGVSDEWISHYEAPGEAYPLRAALASGTHGDISSRSGDQAREFAESIRAYNTMPDRRARLVNATVPMYCAAVDEAEATAPFLRTIRGCFGHSWDVWPVSLAKYVADMRDGERRLMAAEALMAVAGAGHERLEERQRAEWLRAMLADHAWNGTDPANKMHNADLRRQWSAELKQRAAGLVERGWEALDARGDALSFTVFNSLSVPRRGLVSVPAAEGEYDLTDGEEVVPCHATGAGEERTLWAVSPEVPGFGLRRLTLRPRRTPGRDRRLAATPTSLESPFYRLRIDPERGGITSLVHRATGRELVAAGDVLCRTVYFDGTAHGLRDVTSEVAASGPVSAAVRIVGETLGALVATDCTVYAELDRVYFDVFVRKPTQSNEERLCHVFPVVPPGGAVRIETPGAVIRPYLQPDGDLLPGADTRRFAVQGFVDASLPDGPGVTIAPLDAFVLRMDLDPLSFEALGNDQNRREVVQDQHGVTEFHFRYALRAHGGPYDQAEAVAWSQSATTPFVGVLGVTREPDARVAVDPRRAIATCLKPADEPGRGSILRVWETAGQTGPLPVGARGFRRAMRTDLLERDIEELAIESGQVLLPLDALGLAALRLLP